MKAPLTVPATLARRSLLLAALLARVAQGAGPASTPGIVPVALDESPDLQRMLDILSPDLGFTWSRHVVPWARVISMAEQGSAIGMSIARSQEREARLEFSEPIFLKHAWMIVRRGQAFAYKGLDDLHGRSVCLRRGVSYGDAFEAAEGRAYRLEVVDAPLEARLRMVERGRCDVTVWSSAMPDAATAAKRIAAWPELAAQLQVVPVPMLSVGVHFATRKGGSLAQRLAEIDLALRRERDVLQRLAAASGGNS